MKLKYKYKVTIIDGGDSEYIIYFNRKDELKTWIDSHERWVSTRTNFYIERVAFVAEYEAGFGKPGQLVTGNNLEAT